MTALAEALLAAQRQALNAMMKAHTQVLDGDPDEEAFYGLLDSMGCNDKADSVHLWAALNIVRQTGAQAPSAQAPSAPKPQTITDGQRRYIADLFRKGKIEPLPDAEIDSLSFDHASKLIDALKNGTYDAGAW